MTGDCEAVLLLDCCDWALREIMADSSWIGCTVCSAAAAIQTVANW